MQMMELEESISLEIQLLEVLKHESEWRTTEELSKLLNVSYKKTGTLIDNLIWKISRFNSEQIILKSVRGRGIILKIGSIRAYNKFRREIIEDILVYKIIFSIVLNKGTNIVNISLENFVSESLIKKKIAKANKFFKRWEVKIVTRKKECMFVGKESQIRLMLYSLFWRLYRGEEWPFLYIEQTLVNDMIRKLIANLNIDISESVCKKLSYIFAINYSRVNLEKTIEMNDDINNYASLCLWIDEQTNIYKFFNQKYCFSKTEVDFFIFEIIIQSEVFERIFNNPFQFKMLVQNTPAYLATQRIIERYNEYFGNLTEEQYILFFMYLYPCHLYADLFYNPLFSESGYYSLNIISQYVPNMRNELIKITNSLYIESGLKLFINKDYLITKYLLILSEFLSITFKEEEITVLIDTDASELTEKFLKKQINNRFSLLYNVKFLSKTKDIQKDKNNIDIIITTNCLNNYDYLGEGLEIFIVKLFPSQRDWNDIEKYLFSLNKKKYTQKEIIF